MKVTSTGASKVNTVSETHGKQWIVMAAFAPDGRCYYLFDIESASGAQRYAAAWPVSGVSGPGTYYGAGTGGPPCTSLGAPPTSGWLGNWAAASAKA